MSELSAAQALINARSYAAADRMLTGLLDQNPDDTLAWALRIESLRKQGKNDRALALCEQMLGKWPQSATLRQQEIMCLHSSATLARFRNRLAAFAADYPAHDEFINLARGTAEAGYGNLGLAYEARDHLRKFHPHSRSLSYVNSAIYSRKGMVREHIRDLHEELSHNPDDPEINSFLACEYFNLMRLVKACKHATQALRSNPSDGNARTILTMSALVWFPPFLFAQARNALVNATPPGALRVVVAIVGYFFFIILTAFVAFGFGMIVSILFAQLVGMVWVGCFAAWVFFTPKIYAYFRSKQQPSLTIAADY